MPQPRTPKKLKELRGTLRKDRDIGVEPETTGPLGNAPGHLTELECECWHQIAAQAPAGVLANADRPTVELAARLMAQSRADFLGMPSTRLSLLRQLLNSLGMSATARAGLAIPETKTESRWASFK